MPPETRDPTNPREWLRRARSNLACARSGRPTPEVLYEDLCFDAQQAAAKSRRAVLVKNQAERMDACPCGAGGSAAPPRCYRGPGRVFIGRYFGNLQGHDFGLEGFKEILRAVDELVARLGIPEMLAGSGR